MNSQMVTSKSYDKVRGASKKLTEERRSDNRDISAGYFDNGARQQGRTIIEPCGASMGMKPGACTTVL